MEYKKEIDLRKVYTSNCLVNIHSYHVKESKSGNPLPIINNVHIHSTYDPIKESINFIDNHKDSLLENHNVLFLGLGYGYHVNACIDFFACHNIEDYEIAVIEPFLSLYEDCYSKNIIRLENVLIYAGETIENLYFNSKLVDFLIEKPNVIAHPASFNLFKNYFETFLTYRAPKNIKSIVRACKNKELVHFLKQIDQEIDSEILFQELKKSKTPLADRNEFLLTGFSHLIDCSETN